MNGALFVAASSGALVGSAFALASLSAIGCRDIAGIEDIELTTDAGADASSRCGDVSSDAKNCGACGHDCRGALCTDGFCEPQILTSFQDFGYVNLTLDGDELHIATFLEVASCKVSSCTESVRTTRYVGNKGQIYAAAFSGDTAYYAILTATTGGKLGPGAIFSRQGTKSEKTLVTDVDDPWSIVVQGNTLFWSDGGPREMHGKFGSCELPDCTTKTILKDELVGLGVIYVDGDDLYYVAEATLDLGIFHCSIAKACTDAKLLDSGEAFNSLTYDVFFDKKTFYLSNGKREVWQIGLNGKETLLATAQNQPYGLWTRDGTLYGVNHAASDVWKLDLGPPAGKPVIVAPNQSQPSQVVVDDTWIYWGNDGDGTIKRTPK